MSAGVVLVAGCGRVGSRVAEMMAEGGRDVYALSRKPAVLPDNVRPLAADLSDAASLAGLLESAIPDGVDLVVFTASPDRGDEQAYRAVYLDGLATLLATPACSGLRRLVLASSTAVYAQDDGGRVDENSQAAPTRYNGVVLLEAERLAQDNTAATVVVARLGGIYGPGPGAFLRSVAVGELHLPDRPVWTNRVQVDDAARALLHLAELPQPAALYNVVDDTPATRHEVAAWARGELGLPALQFEGAGGNSAGKRCSNALLRASGFSLLYPGYREGYRGSLEELAAGTNSSDPRRFE